MRPRVHKILLYLVILAISWAGSRHAYATLGQGADSIANDRKALGAAKRSGVSRSKYSVQEVASAATTVREFLTPDGVVFAVAWNGLVHPDLTTLLGSYAPEYQSAKRQLPRKHGQKRTQVKSSRVVVETWGHMRNLQGRAYVPTLLPAGVNLNEIH